MWTLELWFRRVVPGEKLIADEWVDQYVKNIRAVYEQLKRRANEE